MMKYESCYRRFYLISAFKADFIISGKKFSVDERVVFIGSIACVTMEDAIAPPDNLDIQMLTAESHIFGTNRNISFRCTFVCHSPDKIPALVKFIGFTCQLIREAETIGYCSGTQINFRFIGNFLLDDTLEVLKIAHFLASRASQPFSRISRVIGHNQYFSTKRTFNFNLLHNVHSNQ